jgi:branched-chain amino acid transport system substrate-binding protein
MPTKNQAAIYAACLHYLRGMAQAGTPDAVAVNRAMRGAKVDWFGESVELRADGRLLAPITTYRVKKPEESKAPFDYYLPIGKISPEQAFAPMTPGCAA